MWWIGIHVGPGQRFRVLRKLGSGVCSTAMLAHDADRDRPVVLKVFEDGLARDWALIQRLEQETKRQAGLDIPGVGTFRSHFRRGDGLVVVRDLVEGISFADWLAEESRRGATEGPARAASTERAVALFESLAGVTAAAHEQGLCHLGLAPGNLFVEAESRALRIVDFGVSTMIGRARYARGRRGSPYLAPEQASEARPPDPRADVYALGVLLHALLARHPNPPLLEKREDRPPQGRRAALLELVRRVTTAEPRSRPANAGELQRAFQEVLAAFPPDQETETPAAGSPAAGFKRSEVTDPVWRRATSTGTTNSAAMPAPDWMRIETPMAMRPHPPGSTEGDSSDGGAPVAGPVETPAPPRALDPLLDTSGALAPVVALGVTIPRQPALSAAQAAVLLAASEEDLRAPTAERRVVPEDLSRADDASGSSPAVSPMEAAPVAQPVASPVPALDATTILRLKRRRTSAEEAVPETPQPPVQRLVGDTRHSADATVALRTPIASQAAATGGAMAQADTAASATSAPARAQRPKQRRRWVLAAAPLLAAGLAGLWLVTRHAPPNDAAPLTARAAAGGHTVGREAMVPPALLEATPGARGEAERAGATTAAQPRAVGPPRNEDFDPDLTGAAAPTPEPAPAPAPPVGMLGAVPAAGLTGAPLPTLDRVDTAHTAVLQFEAGAVHFRDDLWSPGNTWVLRVHTEDAEAGSPLDYYIRRTVTESAPHPWGTRLTLREEGGVSPPRLYDLVASASCLIESESREIIFCMPPRENERQERSVAGTTAAVFALPSASGEVVFDPDLGWVEERSTDAHGHPVVLELAGYQVGTRAGGDVGRATPSCHWDDTIRGGLGIGRNDEGGVLSPDMQAALGAGVAGRLRRIDMGLVGPHGFGRLRAWYSRWTSAYRLEPVLGAADGPVQSVPLPVHSVLRFSPPQGPEYVVLQFAREGMEQLDLITLGPGPQDRVQTLLPETAVGGEPGALDLVPGPQGCSLTLTHATATGPQRTLAVDLGPEGATPAPVSVR